MIVTLIGVGLICIGLLIMLVLVLARGRISWRIGDFLEGVQVAAYVIGGVVTIVSICVILLNIVFLQYEYESKLHEREMLEYRIEHLSEDTVGNEMLYNDIVEFNNSLRWAKHTANSPWISWFSNHKVAGLDYVGLD